MMTFVRGSVVAFCIWCVVGSAAAETYELVKDFGVQGSIRRCKYSNGKVYGLPKTAPACYERIEKSSTPSPKTTNDDADQADLPNSGIWWHVNEVAKCADGVSPAQALLKLEEDGLRPEIKKDGERIALVVNLPKPAQHTFYPTKKKCEEALARGRPKQSEPLRNARALACTNKALAEGEDLRNTVKKWQVECDVRPNCDDCVLYFSALRIAQEWDRRFPGCGPPLGGSKLMMSTVVRHLNSMNCRY